MTKQISDDDFESEVVNSKKAVLVDFWAPWCGPCKMIAKNIEKLSEEMQDTVKIVKMDIEENPITPSKFNVRSIPTLILFKDGKQIDSKIGGHYSQKNLKEWLDSYM